MVKLSNPSDSVRTGTPGESALADRPLQERGLQPRWAPPRVNLTLKPSAFAAFSLDDPSSPVLFRCCSPSSKSATLWQNTVQCYNSLAMLQWSSGMLCIISTSTCENVFLKKKESKKKRKIHTFLSVPRHFPASLSLSVSRRDSPLALCPPWFSACPISITPGRKRTIGTLDDFRLLRRQGKTVRFIARVRPFSHVKCFPDRE